jgi:hypothetical protein
MTGLASPGRLRPQVFSTSRRLHPPRACRPCFMPDPLMGLCPSELSSSRAAVRRLRRRSPLAVEHTLWNRTLRTTAAAEAASAMQDRSPRPSAAETTKDQRRPSSRRNDPPVLGSRAAETTLEPSGSRAAEATLEPSALKPPKRLSNRRALEPPKRLSNRLALEPSKRLSNRRALQPPKRRSNPK